MAHAATARFKVQLTDVRGEGILNNKGEPADTYLKFNFDDYKTFKTETMNQNANPRFVKTFPGAEGVNFHYETKFFKNLATKHLKIEAWDNNYISDEYLGEAEVDLLLLATGPETYSLLFRKTSDGSPAGRLYLTIRMVQVVKASLHFAYSQEPSKEASLKDLATNWIVLEVWSNGSRVAIARLKTLDRAET
ncbi:hypothetical protein T484DRAFT_1795362 [Baffinella frigidus]|nr:hypothetical protein T484DRAFT_1795362 [Cryptophyta sp. CCMP2293]